MQEWGAAGPEFVAAYRLEHDMSWTPEKDFERKGFINLAPKTKKGSESKG